MMGSKSPRTLLAEHVRRRRSTTYTGNSTPSMTLTTSPAVITASSSLKMEPKCGLSLDTNVMGNGAVSAWISNESMQHVKTFMTPNVEHAGIPWMLTDPDNSGYLLTLDFSPSVGCSSFDINLFESAIPDKLIYNNVKNESSTMESIVTNNDLYISSSMVANNSTSNSFFENKNVLIQRSISSSDSGYDESISSPNLSSSLSVLPSPNFQTPSFISADGNTSAEMIQSSNNLSDSGADRVCAQRAKNRTAAQRCRERKREAMQGLKNRVQIAERRHSKLRQEKARLKLKIAELKLMLLKNRGFATPEFKMPTIDKSETYNNVVEPRSNVV